MNSSSISTDGARTAGTARGAGSQTGTVRFRWCILSWLTSWLLVLYFGIVLPIDRPVPILNHWYAAVCAFFGTAWLTWLACSRWVFGRPNGEDRAKNVVLVSVTLLSSLLAVDIGSTAYENLTRDFRRDPEVLFGQRLIDDHVWDGELMPAVYAPSESNFRLYKPLQLRAALVYGEHYYPELLRHELLKNSVLERRKVEFIIDQYGLRNVDAPATARIFVLGDSFCFGYHTTQSATFSEVLKTRLGEPVYNMGVSGTSPMEQFLLLQHMLNTYPQEFRPRELLWLIFEGNDLEEDYATTRRRQSSSRSLTQVFQGTLVGAVASVPGALRQESVLRRVLGGQLSLTSRIARKTASNHYELDGDTLVYPLFRSERFGARLFRQVYLDRAGEPESYVLKHPNAPKLADTFGRMRKLAVEHGVTVTVVTVPTDVRLYKDAFEDLPPVSEMPHFMHYVRKLAQEAGFGYVDLYDGLLPYAKEEMLYYKDDTHWNERGHRVVAELLEHSAVTHMRTGTN